MSLHCWAQTLRHNLRSVKLPMEYELNYIHDTWYLLHPPQFEVTNHAHTAKLNEAYIEHIEKGRFGWHHKAWTDLWRSSCLWSSFYEHSKLFYNSYSICHCWCLKETSFFWIMATGVSWVKDLVFFKQDGRDWASTTVTSSGLDQIQTLCPGIMLWAQSVFQLADIDTNLRTCKLT